MDVGTLPADVSSISELVVRGPGDCRAFYFCKPFQLISIAAQLIQAAWDSYRVEVIEMNGIKMLALVAMTGLGLTAVAGSRSEAQISVSIGAAPVCPYGYYDYAPYNCSPYGYYGPQYFTGGTFIGVGPWFNGPTEFHGTVNNSYDPQHGYHGPMPRTGDRAAAQEHAAPFKGNEERDGRGHVSDGKK